MSKWKDPEFLKNYHKAYKQRNKAKARAYPCRSKTARKAEYARLSGEKRAEYKRKAVDACRKSRSGWTPEMVADALKAQDGKCAICGVLLLPEGLRGESMAADHDHSTNRPRALLCRRCNTLEGLTLGLPISPSEWGKRVEEYRERYLVLDVDSNPGEA